MLDGNKNSKLLNEVINEAGCVVIDQIGDSLLVDLFASRERYFDYLNGINCKQGAGIFSANTQIQTESLKDNLLFVFKKEGAVCLIHQYEVVYTGVLKYTDFESSKPRSKTIKIRTDKYSGIINLVIVEDVNGESTVFHLNFKDREEIDTYLFNRYGKYTLSEILEEESIDFEKLVSINIKNDFKFIAVDFETNGQSTNKLEVVQIGACKFENGVITERFNRFIKPNYPVTQHAQAVHQIDPKDLFFANTIDFVIEDFLEFINGCPLVFHNANSDLTFFTSSLKKTLSIDFHCTYESAKDVIEKSEVENYRLLTLANHFGINYDKHHDAIFDAEATGKLFLELIKMNPDVYSFENKQLDAGYSQPPQKELVRLAGILEGVFSDNEINPIEQDEIKKWVKDNCSNIHREPFKGIVRELIFDDFNVGQLKKIQQKIIKESFDKEEYMFKHERLRGLLEGILKDQEINLIEFTNLKKFIIENQSYCVLPLYRSLKSVVFNESNDLNAIPALISKLLSGPNQDSQVNFIDKKFCMTGEPEFFESKKHFAKIVTDLRGEYLERVTKHLDYLVVGNKGSDRYIEMGENRRKQWNMGYRLLTKRNFI